MTENELLRKNILLDRLRSDLNTEEAMFKYLETRIGVIQKHLATRFDDIVLNMYYLQSEICQTKISSWLIQIQKLNEEIEKL